MKAAGPTKAQELRLSLVEQKAEGWCSVQEIARQPNPATVLICVHQRSSAANNSFEAADEHR